MLFTKERSHIETVNDRDDDVVNLFDWIRMDPERLSEEIYWTPYSRTVYERAWAAQHTETDSFQRAVDFYIRLMMGHGFRITGEIVRFSEMVKEFLLSKDDPDKFQNFTNSWLAEPWEDTKLKTKPSGKLFRTHEGRTFP